MRSDGASSSARSVCLAARPSIRLDAGRPFLPRFRLVEGRERSGSVDHMHVSDRDGLVAHGGDTAAKRDGLLGPGRFAGVPREACRRRVAAVTAAGLAAGSGCLGDGEREA